MKKVKRKHNIFNYFIILVMFICIVSLCISVVLIIKWYIESNKTDKQIMYLQDKVSINTLEDNDSTIIIDTPSDISSNNPYFDYIKMNLIDVNINELKKINNHVSGWIQVNGTNINYPFVQAYNNEYYLTHSFDKSVNSAGWVFLDYRNNRNSLDQNNILYAHGRQDKTMFGSLKNILTNGWLDNKDNYIIKMSTSKENTLWQVFSVYVIPETSDYLTINFNTSEEFMNFGKMLIERSNYNFDTSINENDKIITLSTCYNTVNRLVLHAKLIKMTTK